MYFVFVSSPRAMSLSISLPGRVQWWRAGAAVAAAAAATTAAAAAAGAVAAASTAAGAWWWVRAPSVGGGEDGLGMDCTGKEA